MHQCGDKMDKGCASGDRKKGRRRQPTLQGFVCVLLCGCFYLDALVVARLGLVVA